MSTFAKKILSHILPSDSDWVDHLIEAHKVAPSMTPQAYAPHKTKTGKNSYEILADSLTEKHSTVLDLACGDGHLIQYLLPKLGQNAKIHAVDMSNGELDIAKATYKDPRIQFYEAKAQGLPLEDRSVDLALSHMAFMLMIPLEPVVSELARTIKPGGKFAAVIGGNTQSQNKEADIRKILRGFISHYPKFREVRWGDPRLESEDGMREIFKGTFTLENIRPIELLVDIAPEAIWDWVKDLYPVAILPEQEKAALKVELTAFAKANASENRFQFESSMRMITATRND
jgi:SAM-dependent methyltransferase